jgi:magnesium-transporting ATPase (P-type)
LNVKNKNKKHVHQDKASEFTEDIETGVKIPLSGRNAIGSNATDRALLMWADGSDALIDSLKVDYLLLSFLPFSSATKLTATVVKRIKTGEIFVLIKGAPEYILPKCSNFFGETGQQEIMTEEFKQSTFAEIDKEAHRGRRIVSLAQIGPLSKEIYDDDYSFQTQPPNFPIDNASYVSSLVVSDPPKVSAKDAVDQLRNAGIQVAMVCFLIRRF